MISIDELFRDVKNIEGVKGAFKAALQHMEERLAALEGRNLASQMGQTRAPGRPPKDVAA